MVDTEMTTTPTQKPETIRLADALKRRTPFLDGSSTIAHAEKELPCAGTIGEAME